MLSNQPGTRIDGNLAERFNKAINWATTKEIGAGLFAPNSDYCNKPKGTSDQGRCGDNDDD